jgi:hypothetical protein
LGVCFGRDFTFATFGKNSDDFVPDARFIEAGVHPASSTSPLGNSCGKRLVMLAKITELGNGVYSLSGCTLNMSLESHDVPNSTKSEPSESSSRGVFEIDHPRITNMWLMLLGYKSTGTFYVIFDTHFYFTSDITPVGLVLSKSGDSFERVGYFEQGNTTDGSSHRSEGLP